MFPTPSLGLQTNLCLRETGGQVAEVRHPPNWEKKTEKKTINNNLYIYCIYYVSLQVDEVQEEVKTGQMWSQKVNKPVLLTLFFGL